MKKIFLITTAVITLAAFFASCKNPVGNSSVTSSPQQGGGSSGSTPPTQITITVAGDGNVELKTTISSFKIDKNKTWAEAKDKAEKLIKYKAGYENHKWRLTDASGTEISPTHKFETDTTVYAVSQLITVPKITITVAGDSNVILKSDRTFEIEKGKTWNVLETEAKKKIQGYRDKNYKFKEWRLTDNTGALLDNSYTTPFDNDATAFVVSEPIMITLTITGEHVNITSPPSIKVQRGTKWGNIKTEVQGKVTAKPNFKIIAWKTRAQTGNELEDNSEFKGNTTIYVETRPTHVTITIKGDGHVQLPMDTKITKPYGVTWRAIKNEAKEKITGYEAGYVFAAWKKGSADGIELVDNEEFEGNTDVYAITQAVPVSEGVKVPAATITGHDPSYALPKEKLKNNVISDINWRGVFPSGRTVKLSEYTIGKYEVTVQLWKPVYKWAKANGYKFEYDEEDNEKKYNAENQPMTDMSWRDCIVWCNAYTEMRFGNTDHCVYRKSSQTGPIVKDAYTEADDAYCNLVKKGYRLPTEAEWEYAARYQDNATNAEQYGTVYLTKLDSASGATKPIGFNGMTPPPSDYKSLSAETARVAVFNKWWNGTAFVKQSPAVTELSDVRKKDPNKLGLFDMSGNALEWCWDKYSENVDAGDVNDPQSASSSPTTYRVLRGGNWSKDKEDAVYECMVGKRENGSTSEDNEVIGFRLVWQE